MKSYFFCGIGGSGMSALAVLLAKNGYAISGSDRGFDAQKGADVREKLMKQGIALFAQDGSGVTKDVDCVVVSSAVEESVPDVKAARALNIPVRKRAEILADFLATTNGIAIGGTSGKTTVTAMTAHILKQAGVDPNVVNGGIMLNYRTDTETGNVLTGKGGFCVIEADESDGSIALYSPAVSVVTNISLDHKPIEELRPLFAGFIQKASVGAVVNLDCEETAKMRSLNKNVLTFSLKDESADLYARDIVPTDCGVKFKLNRDEAELLVAGRHNVANALAAIGAADLLGVPRAKSLSALASFKGVKRRLETLGEADGVYVIDDFAHNPEKIAATLDTLKEKSGRLIVIFQPHGFAPTKLMKDGYIKTFLTKTDMDDIIIMPEIFYAGGTTTKDISSADIVKELARAGKKAHFIPERAKIAKLVPALAKAGDRVVVMGARDDTLTDFAYGILKELGER